MVNHVQTLSNNDTTEGGCTFEVKTHKNTKLTIIFLEVKLI